MKRLNLLITTLVVSGWLLCFTANCQPVELAQKIDRLTDAAFHAKPMTIDISPAELTKAKANDKNPLTRIKAHWVGAHQASRINPEASFRLLHDARRIYHQHHQELPAEVGMKVHFFLGRQHNYVFSPLDSSAVYFDSAMVYATRNSIDTASLITLYTTYGFQEGYRRQDADLLEDNIAKALALYEAAGMDDVDLYIDMKAKLAKSPRPEGSLAMIEADRVYEELLVLAKTNPDKIHNHINIGKIGLNAGLSCLGRELYPRSAMFFEESMFWFDQDSTTDKNYYFIAQIHLLAASAFQHQARHLDVDMSALLSAIHTSPDKRANTLENYYFTAYQIKKHLGHRQLAASMLDSFYHYSLLRHASPPGNFYLPKTFNPAHLEWKMGDLFFKINDYKNAYKHWTKNSPTINLDKLGPTDLESTGVTLAKLGQIDSANYCLQRAMDRLDLDSLGLRFSLAQSEYLFHLIESLYDKTKDTKYVSYAQACVDSIYLPLLLKHTSSPELYARRSTKKTMADLTARVLKFDQVAHILSDPQRYMLMENLRSAELFYERKINAYWQSDHISESDQKERQKLQEKIIELEAKKSQQIATKAENRELLDATQSLESLERRYGVANQSSINQILATPSSLAAVQNKLDNKTCIVSYFLHDHTLYTATITQSSITSYVKRVPRLNPLITNWRHDIAANRYNRATNDSLYQQLIADVIADLPDEISTCIILPDGDIHAVAFEALQKADGTFLLSDYKFSYHLAAQLWQADRANPLKNRNLSLTAFAPEYARPSTQTIVMRDDLVTLPAAQIEASTIAELWNGKLFQGAEATIDRFKQAGRHASILHLAMHAEFVEPMYFNSALLFSDVPDRLTLGELSALHIPAHLVTLSACNTGRTSTESTIESKSLARGFLSAGVSSVLMSLWAVPDESTAAIMTSFYEKLAEGHTKDDALRLAKLQFIDDAIDPELRHPMYWAGMVAFGDMQQVLPPAKKRYISLWLLLGLTVLIFARKKLKKIFIKGL